MRISAIKYSVALVAFLLCGRDSVFAQSEFKGFEAMFTQPKSYVVQHTSTAIKVDGVLQESDWQKVEWTSSFVDIEGAAKPLPAFDTKVKMLWNDSTLFIAAKMVEPQVWATQTHHDDIIYKDNDFEIFIDPDNDTHQYFEIEVNALNKIFDLFLSKPYRNGGDALISWDVAGLKSAVTVQGTLNNTKDTDKGWTVEMAIPMKALMFGFNTGIPKEGATWRVNFSRVEWDTKIVNGKNVKLKDNSGKNLPERNWVWSPQGVINMHCPERWGYLQFSRNAGQTFTMPYSEKQRQWLWLVYYKQKEFFAKNKKYAIDLPALGMPVEVDIDGKVNQLSLTASAKQFSAAINTQAGDVLIINDEGLVKTQTYTP
ncbi:carbohydrate-binding family 9-like protein [Mucilaginibacter gynuensis]|uniref:Carbohydrate-binding family 9-like protein n=1 Tax=Mucilaginibacter gynuensis TaxID=1302236 RepID=A0ABP8GUZ6_9SPHI